MSGIKIINDLLDETGNFLGQNELETRYNIKCNFIDHLRIRQSIPRTWRNKLLSKTPEDDNYNTQTSSIYIMLNHNKQTLKKIDFLSSKTQDLYWSLINNTTKKSPNCIQRWNEFYLTNSESWSYIFQAPFRSCRETYLQSFQYRIIHRIFPCNNWLFNLKIQNSNLCSYNYCNDNEVDTIQHHLVNCTPVKSFWNQFVFWWNNLNFSKLYPLVEENIVLGFPISNDEDIILNFCLILGKYYIYITKKCQQDIFFLNFLIMLKEKLVIEEGVNLMKGTIDTFYMVWGYLFESV